MAKVTLDSLVAKHRKLRDQKAKIVEEMTALEEQMRPLQAQKVAQDKLKRAGLSPAELEALGVKDEHRTAVQGGDRREGEKPVHQGDNRAKARKPSRKK